MSNVELIRKISCYKGFFEASAYTLRHSLFRGGMSEPLTREVFEKPDGVVILPYDPQQKTVVMVQQFRTAAFARLGAGTHCWPLELPAGMVDGTDTLEHTALRELAEETGLTASTATLLYSYYPSIGACNEQLHLMYTEVDSTAVSAYGGLQEEGEDLKIHVIPLADFPTLIAAGRICDAASIMAMQYLQQHDAQ